MPNVFDQTIIVETNFENFYTTWYSRAKHFAMEYVIFEPEAEDIVQDVFLHLYERQELLSGYSNPIGYLFTSIKNKSLDFLQKKGVEKEAIDNMQTEEELTLRMKYDSLEILNTDILESSNIEEIVDNALNNLPEKCRQIFIMNKFEGKKQKQIAEELNITINTVESQMAIAYKKIREDLKDYINLPEMIMFLIYPFL